MVKIKGDPGKLASRVVGRAEKEALEDLEEAYKAAQSLVEDKYRRVLRETTKKLEEEYSRLEERLRSVQARLELELRNTLEAERNKYIDMAMERALSRIKEEKRGASWYEEYMKAVIERLADESRETGELIVSVAEEDRELAAKLIEEANREGAKLRLAGEPADILGGARASSPDGATQLDFSLDFVVRDNESLLRSVALRSLFQRGD